MNDTASPPLAAIRAIPLSQLSLAPENVRKTPPDEAAHAELTASILAHGLLENLVVRADEPGDGGRERFAVVAGGRRLAALKALAEDGALDADHTVPCRIANGDAAEISLAENVVRVAMHPADQVVAFSTLAGDGLTVAAIAARFGVSERLVEQRIRLGGAAPELLDAYRAGEMDLETLMAFAVTTDLERQRAVWAQVSALNYRPTPWSVKRMLTEERVPASAALARYVGVDAYEAAGGPVMRDLFADERENGVWLEDPALLNDLAMKKLTAVADELSTRWKWAEAMTEVDWGATARFGRIHPEPGQPTDVETAEIETLHARKAELRDLDDEDWTEELAGEWGGIEKRLGAIKQNIRGRAKYRREAFAIAGAIATVDRDGSLQVIQGLVKPEDMPKDTAGEDDPDRAGDADNGASPHIDDPSITAPAASPPDPCAVARKDAGVGIGLADDLRAVRTALVKAHLANDFEAAFDLTVYQLVRAVFARGYTIAYDALDIAFRETPDRPNIRMNDEDFAAWSPGEAMLADWSHLPFEWMEQDDDDACFAALRALPRADKEQLFAAAVARTVKGQLAFEHGARPELEATVARLDIDFAKHVRPTAGLFWSRIRKDRILDIARETLGAEWASSRSKHKKADLARSMERAFAAGKPSVGIGAKAHAAALAWIPPGFAAFDARRSPDAGSGPADGNSADAGLAAGSPAAGSPSDDSPSGTAPNGGDAAAAEAPDGKDVASESGESAEGAAPASTGNGRDAGNGAEPEVDAAAANGGGNGATDPAAAAVPDTTDAAPDVDDGAEAVEVPEFLRRAT